MGLQQAVQRASGEPMYNLGRAMADMERETVDKLVDVQIRIQTAFLEKSAAYINIIFLGGYAAFFGLWQLTEELVTPNQHRWSALLMSISITSFGLESIGT